MELLVACVLAYYLMRHGPQLVAEALAEADYIHRGELSPQAQARRQRLIDAGIDPAVGGAARQYLGNVWRDAWLDLDTARAKRRAERGTTDGGRTFADVFDDAVEAMSARWRSRTAPDADADITEAPEEPAVTPQDTPTPKDPAPAAVPDATSEAPPDVPTDGDSEPVEVDSTQGDPIQTPPQQTPHAPQPERTATMAGTAVVHVTGVQSAAHEARNIRNGISAVTEAYRSALQLLLNRAANLGAATVGDIQQAMDSRTVQTLQAACEALAAAKANAGSAADEAGPALDQVARAFDRIA